MENVSFTGKKSRRTKRFNSFPNKPWFLRVCSISLFENTVGKGEIARNEQFLLFLQSFLPVWRTFCYFFFKVEIVFCKLFQFGRV